MSLQVILMLWMILLLSFLFVGSFFTSQKKDFFQTLCFRDMVDLQKNIVRDEKYLFSFNSISSFLRTQIMLSNQRLAAATAVGNAAAIAAETAILTQLKIKQKNLDLIQRGLITKNQLAVEKSILSLQIKINKFEVDQRKIWSHLVRFDSVFKLLNKPQVAIQSDSIGGVAPNYELKENYKSLQRLALNLQFNYTTKFHLKEYKYKMECAISSHKEKEKWEVTVSQE